MCAIGGIIKLDKRQVFDKETQLDTISLLKQMEKRGSHSWGAYIEKRKDNFNTVCGEECDNINGEIFKIPGRFSEYIDDMDGVLYLDDVHTVLLHTRQATQGSSDINMNNHPFNTKDFILAHNGIIHNDDELKTKYSLNSPIKCDSYIIVALIQHFYDEGNSVKKSISLALSEILGGYACWLYHKPNKELYLFRNSRNPLEYYIDAERRIMMFASEDSYIVDTYNDGVLSAVDIDSLPTDKIWKLQSGELVEVGTFTEPEYKCTVPTTTRNSYCNGSWYGNKDTEEFDKIMCKFFQFLHAYDGQEHEYNHILCSIRNNVFIFVRDNALESVLDKYNFDLFKKEKYKGKWVRYTATKEEMVVKVKGLLNIDDTPKLVSPNERDLDIPLIDGLKDFCNETRLEFEYSFNSFCFKYTDSTDRIVKYYFSKCGYTFRSKDGTLSLKDNTYHRGNLINIINEYLMEDEAVTCMR